MNCLILYYALFLGLAAGAWAQTPHLPTIADYYEYNDTTGWVYNRTMYREYDNQDRKIKQVDVDTTTNDTVYYYTREFQEPRPGYELSIQTFYQTISVFQPERYRWRITTDSYGNFVSWFSDEWINNAWVEVGGNNLYEFSLVPGSTCDSLMDVKIFQSYNNGQIRNVERTAFTYQADVRTEELIQRDADSNGVWENSARRVFTVNPGTSVDIMIQSYRYTTGGGQEPTGRTAIDLNDAYATDGDFVCRESNGLSSYSVFPLHEMLKQVTETYDISSMQYDTSELLLFTALPNDGYERIRMTPNSGTGLLENNTRIRNEYNSDGFQTLEESYNWTSGAWSLSLGNKYTYTYSGGQLQEKVCQTGTQTLPYFNLWKEVYRSYDPLAVPKPALANGINFYPNPVTDELTVELSDIAHFNRYTITDLAGHSVLQGLTEKRMQLDVSGLGPGIYLLRLAGERLVAVEKIMVQ